MYDEDELPHEEIVNRINYQTEAFLPVLNEIRYALWVIVILLGFIAYKLSS